jgi:ABC-type branched-subunit amino acid transport system permease subunit
VHADVQLFILGIAAGSLVALLASGMMIVYRSSAVINFAHGAIATLAAYTFATAEQRWGWSWVAAGVTAIAVATVTAMLFQLLVMRELREAPAVAKLVATLGLLLAITAAIHPIFGDRDPAPVKVLQSTAIRLPFGSPKFIIQSDRLYLALITVVVCLSLAGLYRFTHFGRTTRATVDNARATSLLGYSPQGIELKNWVLSGALAGLAGVLLAGLTQPTVDGYTAMLITAIAISLLADFQSFPRLLIAAMALGGIQAVLLGHSDDLRRLTRLGGWSQALPLLIIIGAVLIKGRVMAGKSVLDLHLLPQATSPRRPLLGAAILLVIGSAWILLGPRSYIDATTATMIGVILALSVIVVTGYCGQLSLAQMSFAGFGAFVAGRLAIGIGLPFPLAILAGGLAAIPVGAVLGAPAVRVRGVSLAVVTLAAAVVMDRVFFPERGITGGDQGLKFPSPTVFGLSVNSIREPRRFALTVLVVAVLVGWGVSRLRRSKIAIRFLSVRANERGAAATGTSVARTKLLAFVIGAFVAGVGGALHGYRSTQASWESFDFLASILLVVNAYLGGVARIGGAIVAGLLVQGGLISKILQFQGTTSEILQIVGGVAVIQIVLLHPNGIASVPGEIKQAMQRRFARARDALRPVPVPNISPLTSAEPSTAHGDGRSPDSLGVS